MLKRSGIVGSRYSNIELLRIVSMFMIISQHFGMYSGFDFSESDSFLNYAWVRFLQFGGKIGVNIFVLIAGYFLVTSEVKVLKKSLKLWFQVFFYGILIFFVTCFTNLREFSIDDIWTCVFPVMTSRLWFVTCYFMMFILAPYINSFLLNLNKRKYLQLLILLTVVWCFAPSFFDVEPQCNDLLWFIYLYCVAGYIRMHLNVEMFRSWQCLLFASGLTLFVLISSIVSVDNLSGWFFYDMRHFSILLISLSLFVGFLRIKPFCNRIINVVASGVFGVYLIHDDPNIRMFLWTNISRAVDYQESGFLFLYSVFVIVSVFVICCMIELVRKYTIERLYINPLYTLSDKINNFINNIGEQEN